MDISSTEIRERARSGLPLDYLVPKGVQDYIHAHQLYRLTRDVT
jgi:nicotinic acid mononucleotide adenylyltransferase